MTTGPRRQKACWAPKTQGTVQIFALQNYSRGCRTVLAAEVGNHYPGHKIKRHQIMQQFLLLTFLVHLHETFASSQFPNLLRGGLKTSNATDDGEGVTYDLRIVGGTNAPSGKYPYMVRGGGCGGSLIAPDIVLTAAHCAGTFGGTLRIGSNQRNSGGETARGSYEVIHPSYKGQANDFMIVKLDTQVNASPVKLNGKANSPFATESLTVIGFGRTQENGSSSDTLREVKVPYVSHDDCRSIYGNTIQETAMLCAGTEQGGKDSCQGDSGGPIMNSAGVQVGVVSFGSGCARPGIPGVYARTSGAIDWINQMICEHSPQNCPGSGGNNGGDSGGSGGSIPLRVRVVHDKFPREVQWRLKNAQGQVILRQDENEVTVANADISKTINAAGGNYKFEIDDGYGDGICCNQGQGRIEVFAADKLVAKNDGKYSYSTAFGVEVPDDGDNEEDVADVKLRVRVVHDNFPKEVEWKLYDDKNKVLARQDLGDVTKQGETNKQDVFVKPGKYRFVIKDGHGDGICCDQGEGKIRIHADGVRVGTNNGKFGKELTLNIEVPASKKLRTDRNWQGFGSSHERGDEACHDNDEETFDVDESIGPQDCEWLGDNMDSHSNLCGLVSVASLCRATCNECLIFK